MDIVSSVTTWVAFIILQITPINQIPVDIDSTYMGSGMIIETRVDEVPAEDYWIVSTDILSTHDYGLISRYESGGYYDGEHNQLFSLNEQMVKGELSLFSVNEAGMPLQLSLTPGPKTRIYINANHYLPYQDFEVFEFMGGKDYTYRYSDGDIFVYITKKVYDGNNDGYITSFSIEVSNEEYFFYIDYANEG